MSNQAFPLSWPHGVERTKNKQGARFGEHSVFEVVGEIKNQLKLLGGSYVVISTNIPLKENGDPYSNPGKMADPGAAVYFHLKQKPYCLPCDRWLTVEHNLWAIAKHIEAMRGQQRWGVGSIEQQFAGYKALAADTANWWDILECRPDSTEEVIQSQYKVRARSAHPDAGGSHEQMSRLNAARDAAMAALKGGAQ